MCSVWVMIPRCPCRRCHPATVPIIGSFMVASRVFFRRILHRFAPCPGWLVSDGRSRLFVCVHNSSISNQIEVGPAMIFPPQSLNCLSFTIRPHPPFLGTWMASHRAPSALSPSGPISP